MLKLIQGNCLDVMATLPAGCADSVVTDPPYGLSFMGKKWDYDVPSEAIWREALRVLKPGGHLLSFAGTRTQHRMCVRIEDAGFEIRDMIAWVYGSGFPKSKNGEWGGTALKPALEPITMARKTMVGTVEQNWLAHGTGALNIDGCRVETEDALSGGAYAKNPTDREQMWGSDAGKSWVRGGAGEFVQPVGRWPANLIHDGSDEVLQAFPQAPGQLAPESFTAPSSKTRNTFGERGRRIGGFANVGAKKGDPVPNGPMYSDKGSAARFFYCAKASRKDRNDGVEHLTSKPLLWSSGTQSPGTFQAEGTDRSSPNNHPTVKPTDLMRYLCRLVTPVGGVVLDPFMGSGSTGRGAVLEGFGFIGIELDDDYFRIAKSRIEAAMPIPEWLK